MVVETELKIFGLSFVGSEKAEGDEIQVQTDRGYERVKVVNKDKITLGSNRQHFPRQSYSQEEINRQALGRQVLPFVRVEIYWKPRSYAE